MGIVSGLWDSSVSVPSVVSLDLATENLQTLSSPLHRPISATYFQ